MKAANSNFKYLNFLSMFYTTILLISVLLDYKFISIGPMLASSATFVISITFFLSDVIAEVYGYQIAKKIIWSSVICLLCFAVIGFFLEKLPTPLEYSKYGDAYSVILNLLFRASLSNAIAILIGAFFNVYFVTKWKMLVKGRYFWLRSLGSSAIGEALYTVIVVSFLNIGIVSFSHLAEILLISYLYKLIFDTLAVTPASMLAAFLKRAEGVDVYDFPENLTPFKYRYVKQ
jgi:uncharacterized integral membrane protein (TIGR00697 family)